MHDIQYSLTSRQPGTHIFNVSLTIAKPDPSGQILSLPNWIPGSYMIRDFSRNIISLQARSGDRKLAVQKLDKSSWRCEPTSGPLVLDYEVYAWDLSVRAAHLDETHGYFNGTSVFLCAQGQEGKPHVVELVRPAHPAALAWRVATALPELDAARYGFGRYIAADYDELIDHPVEMADFTLASFEACGVPHDVVITGRHRADMKRLVADLKCVCETQIRFFGEPAPFDRYIFQIMVVGNGYGGLEHRASTSLLCSRDDLPGSGEPQGNPGERYKTFLGLASHEYFHSWNVKRIKPAEFLPYDLRSESHTTLLWAFEGFTSYYDDLMLVRAGLISVNAYLELLGQQITRHLRTPGRFRQSVADSSFDAWTKYYKQDENSPNRIVSYYIKGSLVALCLDLKLRQLSDDRVSLDDVMRLLWERFGKVQKGVAEDDIRLLAEELSGADLRDFFALMLNSTEELPLQQLLEAQGLRYVLRPADSQSDTGGKPGQEPRAPRAVLGAKWIAGDGGASLQFVFDGGAAQAAGMSAGDIVVAVDGLRANATNLEKLLAAFAVGEAVEIHAFRRDELMRFRVLLGAAPADTCALLVPEDEAVKRLLERWTGNKA